MNASTENPNHHQPITSFPDIFYHNTANSGGINMNLPASFGGGQMDRDGGEAMQSHFSMYPTFQQPSHAFDDTHGFRPQFFMPAVHVQGGGAHHVPIPESLYGSGFECASSIAGFKSWLRQNNHYLPEKMMPDNKSNYQSLSLTMSNNMQLDCTGDAQPSEISLQPIADDRKRQVGKIANREALPRKSIETFGQRTSQYRGVTRSAPFELFCILSAIF